MKLTTQSNVNFISGNWVNNLTPEEQDHYYNEVVKYFTEEVVRLTVDKYAEPIALKYKNV
jgi:hypothetical protein